LTLDTKNGKIVPNEHKMNQMVVKYPKWPKLFQMSIKYSNIFPSRALQNLPENWYFWFEKQPSGNPGTESSGWRKGKEIEKAFHFISLLG
jgi:hypothetical protein